jgi:hypothetical protein
MGIEWRIATGIMVQAPLSFGSCGLGYVRCESAVDCSHVICKARSICKEPMTALHEIWDVTRQKCAWHDETSCRVDVMTTDVPFLTFPVPILSRLIPSPSVLFSYFPHHSDTFRTSPDPVAMRSHLWLCLVDEL